MSILSLRNVVKRYSKHTAVDGISFEVPKGSIFGMLGPNGAGKSTTIRIITSIIAADEGEVFLDGEKINKYTPAHIGYMPEERGLYKKMKVGDHLMYLAQLKGLEARKAKEKVSYWFERFEITDWWNKKVEELSKGMQQKVQFIATVVHEPKLLILDEPFSGLDPINTNLIKDEIYRLNSEGTSVIFSTHRMEQVEQICERIVLISQGKIVLEGNVQEIKDSYKENKFELQFEGELPSDIDRSMFTVIEDKPYSTIIQVKEGYRPNDLLQSLINRNIEIKTYKEVLPTLNEIFIKKVGESNE